MRAFAQKQNRPQHATAIHQAKPNTPAFAPSQAVPTTSSFAQDFSRIPVHGPADSIQETRIAQPKLWRKCACGGSCPQCKADEKQHLQMEQTGSNVAGQTAAPPIVGEALASSGGSLPGGLRADMENRFAHDFSEVRVHTHARGAESAAAVGARAYTVGSNVVFAAGEYAPSTNAGRRLIAHELAHVVQQHGVAATNSHASIQIGASNDPLEREAEIAAEHANKDIVRGVAGDSLSAGVSRLARAPLLQRDDGPTTGKKEEAPMERVPYRDKPADEKKPEADESDQGPALVPASGARPACNPQGLKRKDYLAQPNTSTDDFGLTRLAGTVGVAQSTHKVKGGVALDPLQVAVPPITSVYTEADTFIEGDAHYVSSGGSACPSAKVPLQWKIWPSGAAKIREGELEHCEDLQYAYDVTLGWYAQVVDGLIAKGKTFPDEASALKHLKKLTGKHPNDWGSTFTCLAKKTELRDDKSAKGWHTPQVRHEVPSWNDGCKFSVVRIMGASNFPELGKHPTPSVITGCGESPDAVKALAAKAAAAKAAAGAGGGGEQEAKPGDAAPKQAEPPAKSTEPGK